MSELDILKKRVEELELENLRYANEVKFLVKAENDVSKYKRQLDFQLNIYKQLYLVGQGFNETDDMDVALSLCLSFVQQTLNYERCVIYLCAECEDGCACRQLEFAASEGYYDETEANGIKALRLNLSDEPLLDFFNRVESRVVYNEKNEIPQADYLARQFYLKEFLAYPLRQVSGHVHGLIVAGNQERKKLSFSRVTGNDVTSIGLDSLVSLFDSKLKNIRYQRALSRSCSELEEARDVLRTSEEDLRITLASIADGVIATDIDGAITRINPVAEKLTGWIRADAVGKPFSDVFRAIHAASRKPRENPVTEVLFSGAPLSSEKELLLLSLDGSEYRISFAAAPIKTEEGAVLGSVLVFHDITEKFQLEQRQYQSQKLESLGVMAGGIAHDFNNMLGGIIGAADLLALNMPDDSELKEMQQIIVKTALRAADLTKQLLIFSRRQHSPDEAVCIHKILRESMSLLKRSIDHRIDIRTDYGAENSVVMAEPSLLQNCFLNIGINAAHAMPTGGSFSVSTHNVEIDSFYCEASPFDIQSGRYLEVIMSDTGSGIPSALLSKVFEPFFTTKSQGQGTGLGLSTVYGYIQKHQGAINVYSEEGVGTRFKILLPLQVDDQQQVQSQEPQVYEGSGLVLVVDDEDVMRTTAKAMLENLGYEVALARDGKEGLNYFEQHHKQIDIVLLDMFMPEINGKECFLRMKEIAPETRIVLASGYAHEDDIEMMKEKGLAGFIAKPYRRADLSKVIHRAKPGRPRLDDTAV